MGKRRPRKQKKHRIIEPPEGHHTHTVLCLHGLGDGAETWLNMVKLPAAFGVQESGIKWMLLNAPERYFASQAPQLAAPTTTHF